MLDSLSKLDSLLVVCCGKYETLDSSVRLCFILTFSVSEIFIDVSVQNNGMQSFELHGTGYCIGEASGDQARIWRA